MGMFDEVRTKCPMCNSEVIFQSKAGDCCLSTYPLDSVPIGIANSLDGKIETCEECGYLVEIVVAPDVPKRVAMKVLFTGKDEDHF